MMTGQMFYKRKSDGAVVPINPGPKGDTGPQGPKGDKGDTGEDFTPADADARYVNVDGDTMTGRLDIVPGAGVAYLRLKNAPSGVVDQRQLLIQANSAGGISFLPQNDGNVSAATVYLRLRHDGVAQFLRTTSSLTDGTVETGSGVRYKQNEAPNEAGNLARLVRTPDPTTGDLGLPGYAGSDTGWRDVSSLLINGWTGTVRIRRVADRTDWWFSAVIGGTDSILMDVPVGWSRGTFGSAMRASVPKTQSVGDGVFYLASGYRAGLSDTSAQYSFALSLFTTDPWPSSLPGTEVTPPAQWS